MKSENEDAASTAASTAADTPEKADKVCAAQARMRNVVALYASNGEKDNAVMLANRTFCQNSLQNSLPYIRNFFAMFFR